jgi:hypothetical protein
MRHAKPGHRVGEAATCRDTTDAGIASHTRIPVRRISAGLLVAHVNQIHIIVHEVGKNRKRMSAIDGEHIFHLLLFEYATDKRTAIYTSHRETPPYCIYPCCREDAREAPLLKISLFVLL